MTAERKRLDEANQGKNPWRKWGPYLSERQWGTVREDYSPHGTAWDSFSHDQARSRAYRGGEDGLAGSVLGQAHALGIQPRRHRDDRGSVPASAGWGRHPAILPRLAGREISRVIVVSGTLRGFQASRDGAPAAKPPAPRRERS